MGVLASLHPPPLSFAVSIQRKEWEADEQGGVNASR